MAAIQSKDYSEHKQVGVILDQKIVDQARIYAKQNYSVSLSELLRTLLIDFVKNEERRSNETTPTSSNTISKQI